MKQVKPEIDEATAALKSGLAETFKGLPDLLVRGFLGGGGLKGAMKALGVQLATVLSSSIKKALADSGAGCKMG